MVLYRFSATKKNVRDMIEGKTLKIRVWAMEEVASTLVVGDSSLHFLSREASRVDLEEASLVVVVSSSNFNFCVSQRKLGNCKLFYFFSL